jgi:hypothetical protein
MWCRVRKDPTYGFSNRGPGPFGPGAARALVVVALAAIFCNRAGAVVVGAHRILFVGNSLTTTNDLPSIVESLSAGAARLECRTVAFPGYSLEDHWNRGDAARTIAAGGWTVVVLQQGPSALPESRALLVEYARRFDAVIASVGARTALYMVWPASSRAADFDAVNASYAAAARAVNGLLLPAGDAWRAAWRRDPRIALYGGDGFHPSPEGSYLAALVIYAGLVERSPVGLPKLKLSFERAALLQQAAADVMKFGARR